MNRFKNILVVVNLSSGEHPALARGVLLARHNNANLTAMTVIEGHPEQAILRSIHIKDALETIEHAHREQLGQLVRPYCDAGLDVETVVAHGSTFVEIIRAALQRHHDLVIKSVSSEGIFHRTFLGSVDMHLLRKCPTPLWLIKPGEPETFRRILVPLDPAIENGIKHDLGMNLLRLATSLAEMDGAELMIVHAWHAYEEETLRKYMEPERFEEYLRAWGQESSNRAWRFVSAFGREIQPKSIHLIQGVPGDVIPKFAEDQDIDLVVMGTLGRLSQQGMFIGDTAERILNRLECSVLAVKPAGFVSPVH
jgi:nucleotide-binding universal stress UspA family protein